MAGNARFESSAASTEELAFSGNYPNGQRGNYLGASLDRSGSFRASSESRMLSSGASTPRGSVLSSGDLPPLSHCLTLDPITMGDQKYARFGELKKILGISYGSTSGDGCFGTAHSKPSPPRTTEELQRFRTNVLDGCRKARNRRNKLNDSLNKLSKYCGALNPKQHQRNEMLTTERSVGSNPIRMGTQIHRNPSDLVTQRLEERTKNVVLHKRVRTSMAELRAEGRGSALARQHIVNGRDSGEASDLTEQKICRLPARGEGWDKKMKRKRSVSAFCSRSTDGDGETKRIMHHKFITDPVQQTCDGQGFRSGSSNDTGGMKSDSNSPPNGSNAHVVSKYEVGLPKNFTNGFNKERLVAKGNKLSIREDSQTISTGPVTKGRATRAPRSGPVMAASSLNSPRLSGAFEGWEQPPTMNKIQAISAVNNRKRPLPTGSSPPMAQWVGQRPQKISRTRRANLVSPVSNQDEVQVSAEGCPSPNLGSKLTSVGTSSSLFAKGATNNTQQFRIKTDSVQSPAPLSESEESEAVEDCEGKSKEKVNCSGEMEERVSSAVHSLCHSSGLTKKNKISSREDTGDGIRRQGRSGRTSSFPRVSVSPLREKLGSPASAKPLRSAKLMSDKKGSKSGRPHAKKLSERKVNRLGHTQTSCSPDFTGESNDDREELLAAANFACNASYLACSSPFWKRMEPVFASLSLDAIYYLKQQIKSSEELPKSVSQMDDTGNDDQDWPALDEYSLPGDIVSGDRARRQQDWKESVNTVGLVDQIQGCSYSCGNLDSLGGKTVIPLCQRVLSALIMEDEMGGDDVQKKMCFQQYGDNSCAGSTVILNDIETRNRDSIEFGYDPLLGIPNQRACTYDRKSCNGSMPFTRGTDMQHQPFKNSSFQGHQGLMHWEIGMLPQMLENGVEIPVAGNRNAADISLYDHQYEQTCLADKLLLELQSIGLYPEEVPQLADGEDVAINEDIVELQKELCQQANRKKVYLKKLIGEVEKERILEERSRERIAMSRLVELAYRKKLATRGSTAAKYGVSRVPKQIAVAFIKKTLARCRKFEETGKSCFSEPALRDVLSAPPPRVNIVEAQNCIGSSGFDARENQSHPSDQDFAKTGPILNRGKKKEVLLDDVGGNSSLRGASNLSNTLLGGAKGKRSERDPSKNAIAKTGRSERKIKAKPKQKTAHLLTSGDDNATNKKKDIRMASSDNIHQVPSKDAKESSECQNLQLRELDPIEELGGNGDLSNFLDDVGLPDCLQDTDVMGLDIPMDDLSSLNMF